MESKTNFSRHLKQFDGLTWLTPTPLFYDRSTPSRTRRFFASRLVGGCGGDRDKRVLAIHGACSAYSPNACLYSRSARAWSFTVQLTCLSALDVSRRCALQIYLLTYLLTSRAILDLLDQRFFI